MKHRIACIVVLAGLAGVALGNDLDRAWTEETLRLASLLPKQDRGRVKPLSTAASFSLLRMNHKRSHVNLDGAKRKPIAWFLDTLLFPDLAEKEKFFVVPDSAVLDTIGVAHDKKKKRDRYSYAELRPGLDKLFELAREYGHIEEKARSREQSQVVMLANAVFEFESIARAAEFAHAPLPLEKPIRSLFGGKEAVWISDVVAAAPRLLDATKDKEQMSDEARAALDRFGRDVVARMNTSRGLVLYPPPDGSKSKEWMTAHDVVSAALVGIPIGDTHIRMLRAVEVMRTKRADPTAVQEAMKEFHAAAVERAEKRGEYDKIALEVSYYKQNVFTRSLVFYLLGFLAVALTWLLPRVRLLRPIAIGITGFALAYHTYGIVLRCILRSRPPVSTLYETVLFITAVVVLAALAIEWINRKGIGLSVAPSLGAIGLFVAGRYEFVKKTDTIEQLVAVLDTNFWLATHVTAITIGYAGGLLAGFLGHIYVGAKLAGVKSKSFFTSLTRMVYGTICFSLIFSVVGTILGGVWANESWGRFWGWDPKENGALLIVLYQLVLIHARLGGYIKGFGISMVAIAGNMVIAFSWWGVNLLGVGLHSYGFTAGINLALWTFYGIEMLVLAGGAIWWFLLRDKGNISPA